jgi:CRISPR/Cas system-associated protein endoribonuclease Cas2
VKIHLPADGEVRIIKITDKQFGRIEVFYGTSSVGKSNKTITHIVCKPPNIIFLGKLFFCFLW